MDKIYYSELVKQLVYKIKEYKGKQLKFMEVCGTHTMSIFKHGIRDMLPDNIKLLSGPGCPVCVTPQSYINEAVEIAKRNDSIIVTFGDMIRVPGSEFSLEKMRAMGSDIRVVYSPLDAIKIAVENKNKKVVFLAVGFETTSPVIALTIKKAKIQNIKNFFVLCGMKLIIPALEMLCDDKEMQIDGFLLPGHVSAILGQECYDFLAKEYKKACVISGFEAYDILLSIELLIKQIENNNFSVENTYKRVVNYNGNTKAYNAIFDAFEPQKSEWRGIGTLNNSGLVLKEEYKEFDAKNVFELIKSDETIDKGCICGQVIKGLKSPYECKLFDKTCNPLNPVGACMVSGEGTCAAYYKYGRK